MGLINAQITGLGINLFENPLNSFGDFMENILFEPLIWIIIFFIASFIFEHLLKLVPIIRRRKMLRIILSMIIPGVLLNLFFLSLYDISAIFSGLMGTTSILVWALVLVIFFFLTKVIKSMYNYGYLLMVSGFALISILLANFIKTSQFAYIIGIVLIFFGIILCNKK